jgi:glutamine amidotransferase
MGTIAVIDYGMGNLRSVYKALEHVAPRQRVVIAQDAAAIASADRAVFPGQGAMPDCMAHLRQAGLLDALLEFARSRPLFGVCVGEQMLFDRSEEGEGSEGRQGGAGDSGGTPCLGLFEGRVVRFPAGQRDQDGRALKVPHMGWNTVRQVRPHALWQGIADEERFYFVHSYYACPTDLGLDVGRSEHGVGFTSAVARDNIFATQFHPEKSAAAGLRLYANFASWSP